MVVLVGDGYVADERYGPACPIAVVPVYRQCPRVTDVVGGPLGVEHELSAGTFGDTDDAVHDLLGGLVRVPENDHVRDPLVMTTPPTDSPGLMLPEKTGVTIQVPWTSEKAAMPAAPRTANSKM